jgi:hypothetical protein
MKFTITIIATRFYYLNLLYLQCNLLPARWQTKKSLFWALQKRLAMTMPTLHFLYCFEA